MPKLIKGIKKKIKGKKHKENELFTPEEYEQYKKKKEEEASAEAEKSQQPEQAVAVQEEITFPREEEIYEAQAVVTEEAEVNEENLSEKGNWRNFLSATDSVLKNTTVNLEHIKESSYFQAIKKVEEEKVEPESTSTVDLVPEPQVTSNRGWADLDKCIDDCVEEEQQEEEEQEEKYIKKQQPEVVLKPIEDLPEVAAEDYADVFDTTFVDEVEAGQVQLFEIPDFEPVDLGEDPFDTSNVDEILQKAEPKKVKEEKKQDLNKPQKKKKKNLVNLGCAVDVLTGKVVDSPTKVNSKVDAKQEISLLADFDSNEPEVKKDTEEDSEKENKEEEVNSAVDDILFGGELDTKLSDILEIQLPTKSKENNTEKSSDDTEDHVALSDDLALFLDPLSCKNETTEKEDSHLEELTSELNSITKDEDKEILVEEVVSKLREIPKPLGFDAIGDNIKDEFDAEFAAIAAESVAKDKEKEIDEIGLAEGDDPFDISSFNQVLGDPEEEKDPFNVEFASIVIGEEKKKAPERPHPPKLTSLIKQFEEVNDPFDTSVANKVIPVDHLDLIEDSLTLPEILKPLSTDQISEEDNFDPFDTSAADLFGKTELKVLVGEFLSDINPGKEESDDFDFNPRADEVEKEASIQPSSLNCLLTNSTEVLPEGIVLTPQTTDITEDKEDIELDPFDTSIADKIHIKSLEADFLIESIKKIPDRPASPNSIISSLNIANNSSVTELSSALYQQVTKDIDPFDTSIADQFQLEVQSDKKEEDTLISKDQLQLQLKPPRPPSPFCLLATTPLDENPTLQPVTKNLNLNHFEVEEIDPFDTSIAETFGKTELRALESELLKKETIHKIDIDEDFDPRGEETVNYIKPCIPPPRPVSPACLLTSNSPVGEQSLPPLSPTTASDKLVQEEFDPFDTSIANHLGKTEIQNLEFQLLSDFNNKPIENNSIVHSVFETNSIDSNPASIPSVLLPQTSKDNIATEEEIDPFDTSIADKFEKTELRKLKETPSIKEESKHFDTPKLEVEITDTLFAISPSADSLPFLQPQQTSNIVPVPSPDIDPFDTSIADRFGISELKVLESQLLVNSGTKRVLSDDEFDPREEETKATKRPSSLKTSNQNILDSAENLSDQSLPVLQATAVISVSNIVEDIDPFDTSFAESLGPSKQELQLLDKEFLSGK